MWHKLIANSVVALKYDYNAVKKYLQITGEKFT